MLFRGEHGLNAQEAAERAALLRIEAVGVAAGVERGGALVRRKLTQSAEAAANSGLLVRWQRGPVARGRAYLVTLLRREVLHIFVALDEPIALVGRHGVELGKAVAHALLRGLGQIVEAGFVLKRLLLLRRREIAVDVHPLGEMLATRAAAGVGTDGGAAFAAFNRSEARTAAARSRLLLLRLGLRPRLGGLLLRSALLRLAVCTATTGLVAGRLVSWRLLVLGGRSRTAGASWAG